MRRCLMFSLGCLLLPTAAALAEPADPSMAEMKKTFEELNAALKAQQARIEQLEGKLNTAAQVEIAKVAKELAEDAAKHSAGPKWLDNLEFMGDLRLRYQNDCFGSQEAKGRNRGRFRLRFGVVKTWLDKEIEVGFRLASGSDDDPTTTNQTFDDHFTRKKIWIDQAYAKYMPKGLPGLTVMGGKFATPMVHTDLIWDSDLNPEGAWLEYKAKLGDFEPFAGVGYFVLDDEYRSPSGIAGLDHTLRDVTLHVYQIGTDWKVAKDVKYTVAGAYYDFDHFDVSYRVAGGNQTLALTADGADYNRLAYGYQMFNLVNKVAWRMFDLPWATYFDWVHNCGEPYNRDAWGDQRDAYAFGLKVGQNRKKGDWSFGYKYAYIEANSTPGALNDGDFGHSNRKGHAWNAVYNLADFLTLGATIYWTEPVTGASENDRTVSTRADLIWKF